MQKQGLATGLAAEIKILLIQVLVSNIVQQHSNLLKFLGGGGGGGGGDSHDDTLFSVYTH